MKNILLTAVLVLVFTGNLFCGEPQIKKFDIGNGGTLKIEQFGTGLDILLVYKDAAQAPQIVKDNLQSNIIDARVRSERVDFIVKFLDSDGYEVCRQPLLFSDFSTDEISQPPVITLRCQTEKCGLESFKNISSAVVDYSQS